MAAVVLWCLCSLSPASAQIYPERNRRAVVDAANVIPDAEEAALDARLIAWSEATGHQLVVATVPDLQGRAIEDYGVGLLRHWRLGRKGANDGAILLLAPKERKVRIEVGYGLEPVLTDALTSGIVRETVRPVLRAGDVGGALTAGADRIMAAVSGDPAALAPQAAALPAYASAPTQSGGMASWLKYTLFAIGGGFLLLFLWPVVQSWYFFWPFTWLMPATTKRRRAEDDAEQAELDAKKKVAADEWNRLADKRVAAARKRYGKNYASRPEWDETLKKMLTARDYAAREARYRQSGSSGGGSWLGVGGGSGSSSSGSSSSGFDGGGGSGGGGGASDSY